MTTSRRNFLAALAAAPMSPLPVGLELYSLRQDMARDVPATLAVVRQFGFTDVEVPQLYRLTAREFRKQLDHWGLACSAMVANEDQLKSGLEQAIGDAHTLGAQYVIYPWIPHSQKLFTMDDCLGAVETFNRRGTQFKKAGLRFCYHPHGYEFSSSPEGTLLDTLIQKTDRSIVNFQMDVFWIAWPGQNPIAYLKKYPGRFPLVHLKDLRKGAQGNQQGTAPESDSVPVGSGSIDFPGVLEAAKVAGVRQFYIEDESVMARTQIPESLRYLRSINAFRA